MLHDKGTRESADCVLFGDHPSLWSRRSPAESRVEKHFVALYAMKCHILYVIMTVQSFSTLEVNVNYYIVGSICVPSKLTCLVKELNMILEHHIQVMLWLRSGWTVDLQWHTIQCTGCFRLCSIAPLRNTDCSQCQFKSYAQTQHTISTLWAILNQMANT